MRIRNPFAAFGLLALGLLLTGCQKLDTVNTGGGVARISLPPGPPSELAKVALAVGLVKGGPGAVRPDSTSLGACGLNVSTVNSGTADLSFAISGPDFATLTPPNVSYTASVGTPSANEITIDTVIDSIPAGTERAVTVTLAINSVVTCSGSVSGITISAGATTDIGTIDLKPTGASAGTGGCGGSMTFGSRTFTGTATTANPIGCDPWVFTTVSTSPASVGVFALANYSAAGATYDTFAFVDESTAAAAGTYSFTTGAASGGYGANLSSSTAATACVFSTGTLTLTAVPAVGGNVTGSFSGGLFGTDPSFCPSLTTTKATSGTFSVVRQF